MTPWYVKHKAGQDKSGKKRRSDSYIFYYVCALQRKGWKACDHRNCVSAGKAETWLVNRLRDLTENETLLQEAVEVARQRSERELTPTLETWRQNQAAISANEGQIGEIVNAITSGQAEGPLWQILNERAAVLHRQREQLQMEQRRLKEQVTPLSENFDAQGLEALLRDFVALAHLAQPEELQQLLRLTVRRVEWNSQENIKAQIYQLPKRSHVKTTARRLKEPTGSGYTLVCAMIPRSTVA